jgi:D-serine deaminase-like pyridoxal phosphate-dependent protein
MQRVPARVGDPLAAIDTPALCVDVDPFERNLTRMADATKGVRLRPHAKSHKCATIAKAQIARGAVGICCQKTDEAAAVVEAGIRDVLVTNEIVASRRSRSSLLARRDDRRLVDSAAGVLTLSDAASRAGVTLDVYIEVDVVANRCGIARTRGARACGRRRALARPRLRGLQAYRAPPSICAARPRAHAIGAATPRPHRANC